MVEEMSGDIASMTRKSSAEHQALAASLSGLGQWNANHHLVSEFK
jgi:hypothetical protein